MSISERRNLGSMGAMRLSRKQAIDYMQTNGSLKYIFTMMIECKKSGQEDCLGYILFQQLDRNTYATTLTQIVKNNEIKWLSETKKGLLVECILALGHLYQMGKCNELEGIMDMV
eukprot:9829484-Heterocapsa_arctica.AAC.1